jgi:hypothetical protein
MTAYSVLSQEQIKQASLPKGPRYNAAAPIVHAILFGVIESKGTALFTEDLDRENLKKLATAQAVYMREQGKFGFIGLFLTTTIISWIVGKLLDVILNWLMARMQEWIDRNKMSSVQVGQATVITELGPLFTSAREVLA